MWNACKLLVGVFAWVVDGVDLCVGGCACVVNVIIVVAETWCRDVGV